MKNYTIYFILISLFLTNSLFAQNDMKAKRERVKAQKVAFITEKLNLSTEAAQKFWPIYNEYDAKKEALSQRKRELMDKIAKEYDSLSEDDFNKLGDEFIELNVEEANLAQEYHHKFKEALTPSQILSLYKAENQFKQFLIKQIRERQGMQPRRRN